jgi:hypothetical protein
LEKFGQVIGPNDFFTIAALDPNFRCACISAIVKQNPVTTHGDFFGQRNKLVVTSSATRRECKPRPLIANDLVKNVDTPNFRNWHGITS